MSGSNSNFPKFAFVAIVMAIVIVFVIVMVNSNTKTSTQKNLEEALALLDTSVSKESKQAIASGIEKGKAEADYEWAKSLYGNNPAEMVAYLEKAYIEDGSINDSEYYYLQKAIALLNEQIESAGSK